MNTKIWAGLIVVALMVAVLGLFNMPVAQSIAQEEGFRPRHERSEKGERERKHSKRRGKEVDIEDIDIEAVIEFLEENRPEMIEKLEYLEEENPEEFFEVISGVWRKMKKLEMLKKHNPEKYEAIVKMKKLESQSKTLVKKYRKSEDPAEKENIKQELKSVLGQMFDAKLQERAKRIEQLEEKLKKQREELQKQKSEKAKIVEERLLKLTGEKIEWKW